MNLVIKISSGKDFYIINKGDYSLKRCFAPFSDKFVKFIKLIFSYIQKKNL